MIGINDTFNVKNGFTLLSLNRQPSCKKEHTGFALVSHHNAGSSLFNTDVSSDLAPNWVRLAPNATNLGLLNISFQYILANRAKMYSENVLDLSHLGSICSILGPNRTSLLLNRD